MRKVKEEIQQEISLTKEELNKINKEIDNLSQHRSYLRLKIKKAQERLDEQVK